MTQSNEDYVADSNFPPDVPDNQLPPEDSQEVPAPELTDEELHASQAEDELLISRSVGVEDDNSEDEGD